MADNVLTSAGISIRLVEIIIVNPHSTSNDKASRRNNNGSFPAPCGFPVIPIAYLGMEEITKEEGGVCACACV